jgi:hypothetical protein
LAAGGQSQNAITIEVKDERTRPQSPRIVAHVKKYKPCILSFLPYTCHQATVKAPNFGPSFSEGLAIIEMHPTEKSRV